MIISFIISIVTDGFITEESAQDVENFFAKNPLPGAKRPIQQAIEHIRYQAAWAKRDKEAIIAWLDKNY